MPWHAQQGVYSLKFPFSEKFRIFGLKRALFVGFFAPQCWQAIYQRFFDIFYFPTVLWALSPALFLANLFPQSRKAIFQRFFERFFPTVLSAHLPALFWHILFSHSPVGSVTCAFWVTLFPTLLRHNINIHIHVLGSIGAC